MTPLALFQREFRLVPLNLRRLERWAEPVNDASPGALVRHLVGTRHRFMRGVCLPDTMKDLEASR